MRPMLSSVHERALVVAEARSWLGTPFHHGARVKGAGVDCAQLLIAVYAGLELADAPTVGFYSREWFLHEDVDRFGPIIGAHCTPIEAPAPGDIALFRFGRAVSHAGIVVENNPDLVIVHSFGPSGGVALDSLAVGTPLRERLAGFWTLSRWSA